MNSKNEQERQEREAFHAGTLGSSYHNYGGNSYQGEEIRRKFEQGASTTRYMDTVHDAGSQFMSLLGPVLRITARYSLYLYMGFVTLYYPARALILIRPIGYLYRNGEFKTIGILFISMLIPAYLYLCTFHYLRPLVHNAKRKRSSYWWLGFSVMQFLSLLAPSLLMGYWITCVTDELDPQRFIMSALLLLGTSVGIYRHHRDLMDEDGPTIVKWAYLSGKSRFEKR